MFDETEMSMSEMFQFSLSETFSFSSEIFRISVGNVIMSDFLICPWVTNVQTQRCVLFSIPAGCLFLKFSNLFWFNNLNIWKIGFHAWEIYLFDLLGAIISTCQAHYTYVRIV